jgi:hypothetical protein
LTRSPLRWPITAPVNRSIRSPETPYCPVGVFDPLPEPVDPEPVDPLPEPVDPLPEPVDPPPEPVDPPLPPPATAAAGGVTMV